jgi:autotransporter-associated beta strand protein
VVEIPDPAFVIFLSRLKEPAGSLRSASPAQAGPDGGKWGSIFLVGSLQFIRSYPLNTVAPGTHRHPRQGIPDFFFAAFANKTMKPRRLSTARLSFPLATAIAAMLAAPSLHAADGTWTSDASANWTDTTRWSGGIIANGTDFTANFTANITATRTVTLDTARTIGNITFTDSTTASNDLTISGANILTLDVTTGSPILNPTNRTITISSGVAGNDGLSKNGAGGASLNAANTYTGVTTITAGSLTGNNIQNIGVAGSFGLDASNIVMTGGGFGLNAAGNQSTDRGITFNGNSILLSSNAAGNLTLSGLLTSLGVQRDITKGGAGTVTLNNDSNPYVGRTFVSGGTLVVTSISAVGAGNFSSIGVATTAADGLISIGTGTTTTTLSYIGTGNTTDRNLNLPGTTGGGTISQSGMGLLKFTGAFTATGAGSKTLTLTGSTVGTGEIASIIVDNSGTNTTSLTKAGTGTWTLSGANTYTGTTAVNGGLLILDYSSQDNSKLADGAALTLGAATLELSGGSHIETVLSTTLTAGTASRLTRSSGTGVLQMNAITRNAGATIDFSAPGIATTDTTNTNGILGTWATIAGTDFAANSTNGADGLITAAVYTDVTRLASGTKVVADGATNNVRIIEGTGAAADITLAAATTTINTLNHSIEGGTSAATIDSGGQTLRTNAILAGPTAGLLTIGNGTLATATAGGELGLISNSANGITINSIIADNTTASALIKQGTGLVTLGTANTYTGTTTVNQGTLTVGPTGSLGSTTAALAVNNDNGSGPATNTILNLTSGGHTTVGNLTSTITPLVSGTNTVTINTGGSGLNFTINQTAALNYAGVIAGAGNFIYNGSATNSLTLSGANTYTGSTTIGANGLLILSNVNALGGDTPGVNATSGITMADGSRFVPTLTGVVINAPITVGATGTTVTINAPNVATQTFTDGVLTLGGAIGGAGNVTFNSSQNVNNLNNILLTAQSNYLGSTLMNTSGGTASQIVVRLGIDDALPTTTVLTINGGTGTGTGRVAEFVMNGYDQTLAGLSNVTQTSRVQRVVNSNVSAASTLTINGSVDSTYGGAIGVNSAGNSMGVANFPGGTNGNNILLTKNGSGTFALTGANTFSGRTLISGGILSLGNSSALSQSPLDTQNSVTGTSTAGLRTTVTALTLGGLTGNKDLANVFETVSGGYTGLTALTLNPVSGATHTYSGDIGNGAGSMTLTKTGAGTQVLSGTNTYTGDTLVSAGTLLVTGTLSSSAVTVGAAGTIGSNGLAGSLGNGLTISAGGDLNLTGASLGLNSTGILSITGGSLTLGNLAFTDLIGWDWLNADNGTYELIDGSFTVDFGSTAFLSEVTAYDFGNGKKGYFTSGSLNAVVIPEPGAALLGGLGLLTLLRRRRS